MSVCPVDDFLIASACLPVENKSLRYARPRIQIRHNMFANLVPMHACMHRAECCMHCACIRACRERVVTQIIKAEGRLDVLVKYAGLFNGAYCGPGVCVCMGGGTCCFVERHAVVCVHGGVGCLGEQGAHMCEACMEYAQGAVLPHMAQALPRVGLRLLQFMENAWRWPCTE